LKSPLAITGGHATLDNGRHVRWPVLGDEDRAAVMAVLDRGVLSGPLAPEVRGLEREFAAFVGARHCLATNSGTSSLHIALAAAGVGPGDEVVTTAYSFVATALAVLHQDAIPVFVDIEPRFCGLDPALLEAALTPRTRAILPVHIHGLPCEMDPILDIARRHDIPVIEDACQAHGAVYRGRRVGTLGNMGCFSTQSSKNLPSGEGGLFVTDDDRLLERANRTRMFGEDVGSMQDAGFSLERPLDAERAYESSAIGYMYRTNEMSAALARSQLRRLVHYNERARHNARRLSTRLGALPGVEPPATDDDRTGTVHKYRVRFDARAVGVDAPPRVVRDALLAALRAEGLEVVLWQTMPVPAQRLFRERIGYGGQAHPWDAGAPADYDLSRFPETCRLLDSSLVLFSQSCPIFPQTDETIDAYADAFERVWMRLPEVPGAVP
jgi:dTDP-4-amino-4,6-dideoxygalactose transaminase